MDRMERRGRIGDIEAETPKVSVEFRKRRPLLTNMTDDAELLSRYADTRSQAAFAQIVERHLGLVYHAAARQLGGDAHLAQDVAQSVFVLLAERARQLRHHPSLAGWLHATTRLKVAEVLRAEARRRNRETAVQTMSEILAEDSSHEADWAKLRPVIDDVLNELSASDREAVLLRFFQGRNFAEIGERLGLTEKSAHKRVERALEKVRGRLGRRGIFSTAALATVLGAQAGAAAPLGLAATVTAGVATAAVAPAAMTLLGAFYFMTTTKVMLGVAALTVAGAGLVYLSEQKAERAARIALEQTLARNAEWETKIREARQRWDDAEKRQRELEARHAGQLRAVQAREWAAMNERIGVVDGKELLQKHPELRAAMVTAMRTSERSQWAGLFRELALSEEQIERFLDLELANTRRLQGRHWFELFPSPASSREIKEEIKALLGEEGYTRYRDYEKGGPGRAITDQLASALYHTASPLSEEQAKSIQQIVRRNYASPQWQWFSAKGWEELRAFAESSLPEAQRVAIDRMHDDWAFYEKQREVQTAYEQAVKRGEIVR
jgi:RNA polymerase sigma factor (sigma-70 family)